MTQLNVIEGIGPVFQEKLKKAGIRSIEALLENGSTPRGRAGIEAASGIGGKLILEWVNHADLFRIKGIGSEYSDLLEEAGVDTVVELAQRKAENLYQAMLDTNARKKLVRRPPSMKDVKSWVDQAKRLPRVVQY